MILFSFEIRAIRGVWKDFRDRFSDFIGQRKSTSFEPHTNLVGFGKHWRCPCKKSSGCTGSDLGFEIFQLHCEEVERMTKA